MNYQNPHGTGCFWHEYAETIGAPNIKWCEETLCHVVSEPANTWSNLGYMIIALMIIYLSHKKNHSFELKQFGPIIFFMGAMSFFYHQSNFYGSQVLDFLGMFFFVGWAKGMNLIRLGWMKKKHLISFNLLIALIYTALVHWMYQAGMKFQGLILVSTLLIVVTEFMAQRRNKTEQFHFKLGLGILALAFGFSISDGKRLWCDPKSHGWFSQGHALWHWIAAIAMLFIYLHYVQFQNMDEDTEV